MENRLEHLDDFKAVLQNYHIGTAGKKVLKETNLALLVAATAGGRNTIVKELLKRGGFHYIVSDTTRKPRSNNGVLEQNGVEYWFRDEADVLEDLEKGKFLEAAIIHNQQVSGISVREINQAHKEGKIALTDIEVVGMASIVKAKPNAHALFVIPPNFKEWMKRIDNRGNMTPAEKRRRLASAEKELEAALKHEYYQYVLNDSVKHAADQIEALTSGKTDAQLQAKARTIIESLIRDTKAWLTDNA